MIAEAKIFAIRGFEFKRSHLLVIGILILAFSISSMIRFQGADYGFVLNEFDPYFNYRATEFLVENGLDEYYAWHDHLSWYPDGRNISATSQVMLHVTAAATYYLFGGGADLLTYIIIFPVVVGSLTCVVIFALVRTMAGTGAGLFAALLFAVSPAIIVRGTMGWFKSEPLGLFYGLLAVYLLLSGIRTADKRIAGVKVASGGILLALGLASWGGVQYFVIPIALLILALPFFRSDHRFLLWAIPLFGAVFLATVSIFERPGLSFVAALGGMTIVVPTVLMAAIIFIKSRSGAAWLRNCLALLLGSVVAASSTLAINSVVNFIPLAPFRYLNAVNPLLTTIDPLVDSISEHATSDTATSFWLLSVLMIFAGIGVWLLLSGKLNAHLRAKPEMVAFSLFLGITGVYVSSAFIRLEVFSALSVVILSSLGLSILSGVFFHPEILDSRSKGRKRGSLQVCFVAAIVILLIIPTMVPAHGNWITPVAVPSPILNGGSAWGVVTNDWFDALDWIKNNTPPDAIIAAWWDYGYWISTLGERTTLVDNLTTNHDRIADVGRMMLSHPDDSWAMLQEMDADYVLIFITAQDVGSEPPTYVIRGGGDEQKNFWFARVAQEPVSAYFQADLETETPFFWENTIMGKMVPFSPRLYLDPMTGDQFPDWQPGTVALVEKDIKLPADGDGPLRLAYASPSYDGASTIIGVFIYEVNQEYVPGQTPRSATAPGQQINIATIDTALGPIHILIDPGADPALIDNFVDQADLGVYNGTFFHRILPGVLLQGGVPDDELRTISPGASPGAGMDGFGEARYMLATTRGSVLEEPNPQLYILDASSPWLAGSYTILGDVVGGDEVVDAIAALETDEQNRPIDMEQAMIRDITVTNPMQ